MQAVLEAASQEVTSLAGRGLARSGDVLGGRHPLEVLVVGAAGGWLLCDLHQVSSS